MRTGTDDKMPTPDIPAARDEATERWLRDEVLLTLEDARAHPERLLTVDELRKRLAHRIESFAGGPQSEGTEVSSNPT
jgi:hypothetical protein